jgi:hypothetical protein
VGAARHRFEHDAYRQQGMKTMQLSYFKVGALVIAIAAMMLGAPNVEASTITTWTLENVTMTGGTSPTTDVTTLVGSFTTDATTQNLISYDIHIAGGPLTATNSLIL